MFDEQLNEKERMILLCSVLFSITDRHDLDPEEMVQDMIQHYGGSKLFDELPEVDPIWTNLLSTPRRTQ